MSRRPEPVKPIVITRSCHFTGSRGHNLGFQSPWQNPVSLTLLPEILGAVLVNLGRITLAQTSAVATRLLASLFKP